MKLHHLLFICLLVAGCRSASVPQGSTISPEKTQIPTREYSIQSVLWQQLSGEYKALAYQAFALAKIRLDQHLAEKTPGSKPFAIITDVDETLIDNSPFNANMIELDEEYTRKKWIEWGKLESATAIPGATEFLSYAASKDVEIFYITNRYDSQKPETIANLKKLGFPFPDEKHFLLRQSTSAKEPRRQEVYQTHNVIMLMGDNLSDFSESFDNKSTIQRNEIVEDLKLQFGDKFIVLPNPMYGDWEMKGLYQGKYDWNAQQKDSIRKAALRSY